MHQRALPTEVIPAESSVFDNNGNIDINFAVESTLSSWILGLFGNLNASARNLLMSYNSEFLVYLQILKILLMIVIFSWFFFKWFSVSCLQSDNKRILKKKSIYDLNSILYINNFFRLSKAKWAIYVNRFKKF